MPPKNKLSRLVKETAGFSYEFIRHPKGVGSVIPSSRMLAKAMRRTAQKFGAPDSLIIEAGAGTGAITRELVAYFPAERLLINEVNPRLARRLRDRFPGNTIRRGRVEELDVWTQPASKTIISSLPFRSLPPEVGAEIERVFFAALRENRPYTVGFAAETDNVLAYARDKRARKNLDLIIANDVSRDVFGADDNAATLIAADGETTLPRQPKTALADTLLTHILTHWKQA